MVGIGLEVLLRDRVNDLACMRVGVLANQASVTRCGEHISDVLVKAGVRVTALFGPEHGVRGESEAGIHVADSFDERLGVPVYSLYGEHRAPSPESLDGIDIMLVDLQDVGARFYTFVWTMANVMDACGKRDIPVWVLDRPNPITGLNPEGPVLEPDFASFVGMFPIPVRHALTIGELARLFVRRFGVNCDLTVIPIDGWERTMFFDDTGCRWTKPSPSMPTPATALYYPGTCLLEGTNVSEGRGTCAPFEIIGAPWVDSDALARTIRAYELPGLDLTLESWAVGSDLFHGIRIIASDRKAYCPVLTGVAILCALRHLHPDEFDFNQPDTGERLFFDLLAGTLALREAIEVGKGPWEIACTWDADVADYRATSMDVMIYPYGVAT